MTYFIINSSINLKETGNYPQSIEMEKGYNYHSGKSIYEIGRNKGEPIKKKLDLNGIILRKSAKPTDFISVVMAGAMGFFINEKAKLILESHNMVDHEYHIAKVYHKETTYTYYWVHLISDFRKQVNYQRSTFHLGENNIKLKSYDDYVSFTKLDDEFHQLRSDKITMTEGFDSSLDLFAISYFNQDIIISEKLKNALLEEKVTGIEIKDNDSFSLSDSNIVRI